MAAVPKPKKPTPAGLVPREPTAEDLDWAQDVVESLRKGPHADYKRFAESTRKQTDTDAFTFISDACESEGGFTDGRYLDAHTREKAKILFAISGSVIPAAGVNVASGGGIGPSKFEDRKKLAAYDNFARTIRDAAWGHIQQSKDLIHRETTEPALEEFWKNADGHDGSIDDFNEEPQQQSQMFGYGVVIVDRPDVAIVTERDEAAPENQPYAYTVPSRNVVTWRFDEDGELSALAYLEPENDEQPLGKAPVRIWTRACWAVLEPLPEKPRTADEGDHYLMTSWGGNPLGKVPIASLYYDRPKSGKFMGKSIMRDVAILSKTVFNEDSEKRELERLCAFPVLCIPTKNPGSIKNVQIGTGSALGYNANAGEPKYVSADLASMEKLQASREKNKESAFAMAHLAAIIGHIETTSGFHAEAEFEKTNKRIGRAAAALEDYETRLAKLFLNWKGYTDEQIDEAPGLVSISYPKTFQIRDIDQMIDRVDKQIKLGLGEEANRRFLRDFFSSLWPRMAKEEMDKLVEEAAKEVTGLTQEAAAGGSPFGTRAVVARVVRNGLTQQATKKETTPPGEKPKV